MTDIKVINYIDQFHQHFCDKYFALLANSHLQHVASFSKDDLFGCPNLLFYGNQSTLLKLFVDAIIYNIFGKLGKQKGSIDCVVNNTKHTFEYLSGQAFIEIDLTNTGSGEKQFVCEFIGQVVKTKNIKQLKHIIVIHNINKAHEHTVFALRKLIEGHAANALFIMTSPSMSRVAGPIQSRCMNIRCNIELEDVGHFFETFIEDVPVDEDTVVEIEDGDVIKKLIQIACPEVGNGFVEKIITEFLDKICKTSSIQSLVTETKAFSFKLLHMNIEFKHFLPIIINYFSDKKRYKKHIYDIVSLATETELKSLHSNKSFVLFENMIYKLYKMIHSCK